ncbi:phosphatases II, partial [Ramicandelaber brevisporus]
YATQPVCIMNGLYLGDEHNAASTAQLSRLRISHILNVAREVENPFKTANNHGNHGNHNNHIVGPPDSSTSTTTTTTTTTTMQITYKKFSWSHSEEDLRPHFDQAFEFIDTARRAGSSVLVHCQLGVSRSATLIVAYVMRLLRLPLNDAYSYVKDRSPCISPNLGLIYQLLEYEKAL